MTAYALSAGTRQRLRMGTPVLETWLEADVGVEQVGHSVRSGCISSLAEPKGGRIWVPDPGAKLLNYKQKNLLTSRQLIM